MASETQQITVTERAFSRIAEILRDEPGAIGLVTGNEQTQIDFRTFATGVTAKHLFGFCFVLLFQLLQVVVAIQSTGSKIAVVKSTGRVLAFVFNMLNVVAQALLIGTKFAVAAQVVLLVQQVSHHIVLVPKVAPAAGGVLWSLRWTFVSLSEVIATGTLFADGSHGCARSRSMA